MSFTDTASLQMHSLTRARTVRWFPHTPAQQGMGTMDKTLRAPGKRVTELANELTTHLDSVSPEGLVRLLRQSDAQLFSGWGGLPSVCDAGIERVAQEVCCGPRERGETVRPG